MPLISHSRSWNNRAYENDFELIGLFTETPHRLCNVGVPQATNHNFLAFGRVSVSRSRISQKREICRGISPSAFRLSRMFFFLEQPRCHMCISTVRNERAAKFICETGM